jgi:hypothetical protein
MGERVLQKILKKLFHAPGWASLTSFSAIKVNNLSRIPLQLFGLKVIISSEMLVPSLTNHCDNSSIVFVLNISEAHPV